MDSEYDEEVMEFMDDMMAWTQMENQRLFDLINEIGVPKRKYTVQKRIDPFEIYDEEEFLRRYRVTKTMARKLFEELNGPETLDPMVNCLIFCSYFGVFDSVF